MMLSELAVDHVQNPRNCGPLDDATGYGSSGERGSGPYIEMWIEADRDHIVRCSYRSSGCPSSIACGSMVAQIAMGRTFDAARKLTAEDLQLILGGLPDGKGHFADMAVDALHAAIANNRGGA